MLAQFEHGLAIDTSRMREMVITLRGLGIRCLRHRFLSAFATARFASAYPEQQEAAGQHHMHCSFRGAC